MTYEGWRIVPHKVQAHLGNAFLVYFYYVLNEQDQVIDRINAVYDGVGEVAIYSQKEEEYIDPHIADSYYDFIHEELNTHRIVTDALQSIKPPVDSDGFIRPWDYKK